MHFFEDGEEIISKWDPEPQFQGYINIIHGGIQATLMDEIASWVVFIKLQTGGVTSSLKTKFRKPFRLDQGPATLRAKLLNKKGRVAEIEVKLYNGPGQLCSEAIAEYFILSPEKARETMNFPDIQAFYQE